MMEWLAGKIAGPIFAGASALLLIVCGVLWYQVHTLTKDKAGLIDRIENKETGYIVSLDRARGDFAACQGSIAQSDARTAQAQRDGEAKVAQLQKERDEALAKLKSALAAAKARAAALARPPIALPGETACDTAARLILEEVR